MPGQAADNRTIWSWAFYDFANSPFTTLVITFVYATFFAQVIAPDPNTGLILWSRAVSVTAVVVAVLSPVLGAIADRGGYRKRFLVIATLVCAFSTMALYGVAAGEVRTALILVVVANIAYEFGTVFYNAFLPDISPPGRIGRTSGFGWGLGYIGGLLALAIALVTLVQPETPWFGFSTEGGENVRATNLLVGVWFLVFTVPLLLFVRDKPHGVSAVARPVRDAFAQLARSFHEVRRYEHAARFLIARMLFNDGLVTIIAFGGIYAATTFGFTLEEVLMLGIVLNVAAGLGALVFGHLDDRLGGKAAVILSIVGLMLATFVAIFATSKAAFWVAGLIMGACIGPNQASSRSLMARFTPSAVQNEFFGFFAFSGKLTAFFGPFLLGVLTQWSGSQRVGISVVLVLLGLGLALLLTVDEEAGMRAARA
ncbi:MAG TPA: MFS transporter [Gammaproteobacteria bacterium]